MIPFRASCLYKLHVYIRKRTENNTRSTVIKVYNNKYMFKQQSL